MQKKIILIIIVLCFCVGCDQATKVVAKDYLASAAPASYAGDIFRLHYAENRGAFLSLGAILHQPFRRTAIEWRSTEALVLASAISICFPFPRTAHQWEIRNGEPS